MCHQVRRDGYAGADDWSVLGCWFVKSPGVLVQPERDDGIGAALTIRLSG